MPIPAVRAVKVVAPLDPRGTPGSPLIQINAVVALPQ
jgi:hypothetical protein